MTAAKNHRKTAAKKRPTKAAAGSHHTQAAAKRHRTGQAHPGERDIDLNSSHPALQPLLTKLRPLLQEVIEACESCDENPDQGVGVANYHNITICKH